MSADKINPTSIRSPWKDFWQRFARNPMALVSGIFVLTLILLAVFAPELSPYDPMSSDWTALSTPPNWSHWMGTDDLGRDVLSRILYGARISMYVGFFSVTLGMLVGIVLGLISGYYGGKLDMFDYAGRRCLICVSRHVTRNCRRRDFRTGAEQCYCGGGGF
ncbi:hypothetical protein P4S72_06980 [Vibrio sp. PP-XX7]